MNNFIELSTEEIYSIDGGKKIVKSASAFSDARALIEAVAFVVKCVKWVGDRLGYTDKKDFKGGHCNPVL